MQLLQKKNFKHCAQIALAVGSICASNLSFSTTVYAQDDSSSSSALVEEIFVTARKREESLQDVPLAVTAFGSDQIETLKVRDLTSLSVGIANVAMDDIGTVRGTANFSIRGLGINSSIASIDPTVGVFVDGVYMGVNSGIVFDLFDIESIEVLRGPQGTLFGRNVTGGAVLINSKAPGDEFDFSARGALDQGPRGGLNTYAMASVSGPIGDTLAAKLTVYRNDDDGGHTNLFDNSDFGAIEQTMIRPTLVWTPNDDTELILRYEYSDSDGDGPAAQSHTNGAGIDGTPENFDRDSFDFSIEERGRALNETHFFVAEYNQDISFGNGTITNIFSIRDNEGSSISDIDAQPVQAFSADAILNAEQISNELRYNGTFADKFNVTTGLYYFNNEIIVDERRRLLGALLPPAAGGLPALQQDGGGIVETKTLGVFTALDYDLSDTLTLNAGLRWTREEKDARVATLAINATAFADLGTANDLTCSVNAGTCPFDFVDAQTYTNVSPKIGLSYILSEGSNLYGFWTRGFRSGGYNLRNTSPDPAAVPGPFDEETVDSLEFGFKSQLERGRISGAVFFNQIDDMQREINLPGAVSGVVQIIDNTANAEILGLELEGAYQITDNLVLLGSIGLLDAEYTDVFVDLTGDGVINDADLNLDLPRAAETTYSIGLNHDFDMANNWSLSSRINYAYRDDSAYTDNNLGFITDQDILDAGIDFTNPDGSWVFSLYGKNLLDTVKHGGDTQLPAVLGGALPVGGTFSPLAKGRVLGIEATYRYTP